MTYVIILPSIIPEVTKKCISSIDQSIRRHLIQADNSKVNRGVSKAWNQGASAVIRSKLDFLFIISATMIFKQGMRDLIEFAEQNIDAWGIETQHGWHCIGIARKTLERVGLFDEQFFAYYEDSDYIRRMELAGIFTPVSTDKRFPHINVDAESQGDAHAIKAGVKVDMKKSHDLFIRKWGAEPRYENQRQRDQMFSVPYNAV